MIVETDHVLLEGVQVVATPSQRSNQAFTDAVLEVVLFAEVVDFIIHPRLLKIGLTGDRLRRTAFETLSLVGEDTDITAWACPIPWA